MSRLWVGTIALGVIGLLAVPMLFGAPFLIAQLWSAIELRPFVIFMSVLYLLALAWLLSTVLVAFKHRGGDRKIVLGCLSAVMLVMAAITAFGPMKTVSVKIDIPPPVSGSS